MAQLEENSFSSYKLTEAEEIEGVKLTITQRQYIQNQLVGCSEEYLALEYSKENLDEFLMQAKYNQGMIAAYRHLIDASDAAHAPDLEQAVENYNQEQEVPYDAAIFIDDNAVDNP